MSEIAISLPTIIYGIGSTIVGVIGWLLLRSVKLLDKTLEQHHLKIETHDREIIHLHTKLDGFKEMTDLKFTALQTNIAQRLDTIEKSQEEMKQLLQSLHK